jgi:DnaJ-class molecular chaperone
MVVKKECPFCQGTGVQMIQTASFLGLIKKEIPATCDHCSGLGYIVELPTCKFCEGQGLVGNERDVCRACNGTGKADAFAFVPSKMLKPGTIFQRRCDRCSGNTFEIMSGVEQFKLTKSWEREEELRQVEIVEKVKVRCTSCGQVYHIPIDPEWHQELESDMVSSLEDMGMNLNFLYQNR